MTAKIPLLFTLFLCLSHHPIYAQIADKVFKNAKVYTANNNFQEAIAIKDGNLIFVGTNVGADAHIGAGTVVENLGGKLMLPGLHDVHMHPLEAGSPIGGDCVLDPAETDPENFVTALQACGLSANSNGWITAAGHSIFTFFDAPITSRYPYEILDDVFPSTPAVVMEETSHSVWLNSAAMSLLGINASTPDPVGGHIVKDNTNGNIPIGILMDNAGDVALSAAFAANATIDALNKDGLVNYSLPLLAENGITSICEGRTYWKRNYHTIWQSIKTDGDLTCRVNLAPWVYPDDNDATLVPALQALYDAGDDMLKTNQLKVYADGILINATAAMHDPYDYNLDLPFTTGLNYVDVNRLSNLITTLEQTGFDFHIHAIGDRGITEALDAIEAARTANGNIGARHRITHLEIVDATDIPRFPALNVTADMQVASVFTNPANWSENNFLIGASRTDSIIPLKAFHDAGARVVLSSDWDVSTVNPFVAMQNALTRAPQALPTVEDVVKAYTIDAAYVMRHETNTGSLEVGKWADFIVVDKDIFTIPTTEIQTTQNLLTYVGGDEVYRSTILSVEMGQFNADSKNCEIVINWNTETELNNKRFIVERSKNGKYFEQIGSVSGGGTTHSPRFYSFVDENPFNDNYYRLRQVDEEGNETVGSLIFARKSCEKELQINLLPNITNYLTIVQVTNGLNDDLKLQLLSANGRLIKQFELKHQGQLTQSPLNVTFLPEGVYYLQVESERNNLMTTKPIFVSR